MKYRITCKNLETKKVEIVDYYDSIEMANNDLRDIWIAEHQSVIKPTPIISNEKGQTFCTSAINRHLLYQVEKFDVLIDSLFDMLKPENQQFYN